MKIADMNWMQVEERAAEDDRCVLPIGSVEQHAYLSLATDMILAEKVSLDAAEPLGIPVFPVLPYGLASSFATFPGTLTLTLSTYIGVVGDLMDSIHRSGFRRILIVNGHGGNTPATAVISEWLNAHPDASVKFHDWWRAPKTWAKVQETDPAASHASWMENFPGRAPPTSASRRAPSRRWISPASPASMQPASVNSSTTATITASTSVPTKTCWRSGTWLSWKPANFSKTTGTDGRASFGTPHPIKPRKTGLGTRTGEYMLGFVLQRLWQAAIVVIAMSALVFCGVYAVGNPIDVLISPDATQDIRAAVIAQYGLDQPLWRQYFAFLGRLIEGDFGRSLVYSMPVSELILTRLPATLELTLAAVLFASLVGIPIGMYAGYRPHSLVSRAIMAISILGFSVPTFWFGLMLIMVFAVQCGCMPAGGRGETVSLFGIDFSFLTGDGLSHLVLPALNLALFKFSLMIRLARAGTRELMLSDTVKFARAAGLSEFTVLSRHVLRLISIPLVTVFGLEARLDARLCGRHRNHLFLARPRQADH